MSKPHITPEMFEGLNFDERVQLRRDLISKYGTSLPAQDDSGSLFNGKQSKVRDAQGNEIPAVGDLKAFKGKNFDQRVEIRQKMIACYGSSLPGVDEESKGKKNEKEESSNKSNFNQRVHKRKVIARILSSSKISSKKKRDIEENKEEYIEDPNIFVSEDGNVKYITDAKERKRVVYEYMASSKIEIDKEDHYEGGWGSSLKRAKKMNKNHFPVFHIPWNTKLEQFSTHQLNEVEAIKSIINNNEFYPVRRYFIYGELIYFRFIKNFTDQLITNQAHSDHQVLIS